MKNNKYRVNPNGKPQVHTDNLFEGRSIVIAAEPLKAGAYKDAEVATVEELEVIDKKYPGLYDGLILRPDNEVKKERENLVDKLLEDVRAKEKEEKMIQEAEDKARKKLEDASKKANAKRLTKEAEERIKAEMEAAKAEEEENESDNEGD